MDKNFLDIYSNVGSNIQDTSTAMQTIIKRYANEVYYDILRRINFECINHDYSFTATGRDNVLPADFGKEMAVYDSTNNLRLERTSQAHEIDGNVESISATGTSMKYDILDLPVRTQFFTAGTASIVSSSVSDTTQYISIVGELATGVIVTETNILTGTTPITTTNSFKRILTISKSGVTVGSVTVTIGTDTIAIFAPNAKTHRVKVMRLYDAPSASITITCPYIIKPLPLLNDYDTPIVDIDDLIELGTTSKAWLYKRQGGKAGDWNTLFERGIAQYIWDRSNQPNKANYFTYGIYDRETV